MNILIIHYKDALYNVLRIVRDRQNLNTEIIKNNLKCDISLKKENKYYFCNKIDDVEVIDFENENQLKFNFNNE